jgi:D-amino peptidase
MKRILLIADMEGIAGVDTLPPLIAGTVEYDAACARMTAQVNAVVEGFAAAGYDEVIVSDSHRGGAKDTNVRPGSLHPLARLVLDEDAYAVNYFRDVEAVACVGMHAPAGTTGFAAHTVSVQCDWWLQGRRLSETDIVLALAAEHGLPVALIAGDDVLCGTLPSAVPRVQIKTSHSPEAAVSMDERAACEALYASAAHAVPVRVPPPVPLPLEIVFKSRWQAEWAVQRGARRCSDYRVAMEGVNFRERYERGHRLVLDSIAAVIPAVRGRPGSTDLEEDITELITRPVITAEDETRLLPTGDLRQTARAFLHCTTFTDEFGVVLRALILHMLEAWAPGVYVELDLSPVLEESLRKIRQIPPTFPGALKPHEGMARMDAWYILKERGLPAGELDLESLRDYVHHLHTDGAAVHAFIIAGMTQSLGVDVGMRFPERPLRGSSRLYDLYWLTHEFLFVTHYLRRPLPLAGWETRTEELLMAVPWLLRQGHADLAAEVALCLQLMGEHAAPRHRQLLDFLLTAQRTDGALLDGSMGDPPELLADHATGVVLLVLAGAQEWNRRRSAVP